MAVPPELKEVKKFLQQAKRMDRVKPLVAYYCRLNAITQAMAVEDKSKDVKLFLASLMTQLEEADPAVKNIEKDEAKKQIELFALLVFKHADDEDRAGKAAKRTVQAFHSAYVFMEVLKYFGDLNEDMVEKSNYAKWKAADIAKALREGRQPTPGPPGGIPGEDEEMPQIGGGGDVPANPSNSSNMDMSQPGGGGGGGGGGGFGEPGPSSYGGGEASTPMQAPKAEPSVDAFGLPEIPFGGVSTPSVPSQPSTDFSNPSFPSLTKPTSEPRSQPSSQPGFQPNYPVHSYERPKPQPSYAPQRSFTNEEKVAAVAKAEKLTKHALSAMRFTDVETTISKLEQVIQSLRPFSSR